MSVAEKIILALDGLSLAQCLELVPLIKDRVYAVKVHDLVDFYGVKEVVDRLQEETNWSLRIWVDYKLHDIPNTVKLRSYQLALHGVDIVTVHASGGGQAIFEARAGMHRAQSRFAPEIYAVTTLTSLSEKDVRHIYVGSPKSVTIRLAKIAVSGGADGIVCSALEVGALAKLSGVGGRTKLIVPGTRSLGESDDDQARIDTPGAAIRSGATHLVIGCQVTADPDPLLALSLLEEEIREALA
jgi:orotidine-5'-phosphate decarboxylase